MEDAGRSLEAIPGVAIPAPARRFARLDFGTGPRDANGCPGKDWRGLSRAGLRGQRRRQRNCGDCAAVRICPTGDPCWVEHPASVHWRRRAGAVHGRRLRRDPARVHHPLPGHRKAEGGCQRPSPFDRRALRNKTEYLDLIKHSARKLIAEGYLLEEDLEGVTAQAAQQYESLAGETIEETQKASR